MGKVCKHKWGNVLPNFRYEVLEMDIKKICKIYASESPIIFDYDSILFSTKQLGVLYFKGEPVFNWDSGPLLD